MLIVKTIGKIYKYFPYRETTKNALWGLVILMIGLLLTAITAFYAQREVNADAKQEFSLKCNEIKIKTANRLRFSAQLLRSASVFFAISDSISPGDWELFNELSHYQENQIGIQGLGYSLLVPKNLGKQNAKWKSNGVQPNQVDLAFWEDLNTSVVYLDPSSRGKIRDFGYDLYADPVQRKAMEMSRDSDAAILSGKVLLTENSKGPSHTGTLIYAPVYRKGMLLATVQQRREAIKGWVFSPFYINELMKGLLGNWNSDKEFGIRIRVYEDEVSDNSLLYDSQANLVLPPKMGPSRSITKQVNQNGKKWRLVFNQSTQHLSYFKSIVKQIIIGGILVSFLLSLLVVSLINTRTNAQRIASKLTLELKENESRIREVLENSLDASYKRNLVTNCFEYLSPAFTRISGYTPEELEHMPAESIFGMVHPEDAAEFNRVISRSALDSSFTYNMLEYRFKHKNGDYPWFENRFSVVRDSQGRPEALIGSISDISKRKNAEEALFQEKLLLRTIIDNIPDSIYCMDLACRKTLANSTDLRYMGARLEADVIGKNDFDFYPYEKALEFVALDQSVLLSGKPLLNSEESLIDENGEKKWLLSSKIPMFDKEGKVIGLLGIGRDITDRRLAEEEVKHKNEELLKLNLAKDKFFSIIAHDLRSPFNGFLGLTQIMVEELPTLTPEELRKIAVSMRDSATNLYRLLENLLQWSTMQQDRISFNPQIIHLNPIIAESLAMVWQSAHHKKIEILSLTSGDLVVFADSNMLQTILRNLISNSVKFTGKGGKITISAHKSTDNFIQIMVKDTGIGMNSAMIDNLFHLDINTSRKGTDGESSTGLGLIICKDFVEKHGGSLWVESEEGKGSTFYFTIPETNI